MASYALKDFLPFDRHPRKIAVIEHSAFRKRKYSCREMQRGISSMVASLQKLGIGDGDRVLLWGENSARWMMTFYACLHLGIVVVPMDASFSRDFVERVRVLTDAKLVCSDAEGTAWNQLLQTAGPAIRWQSSNPPGDQLLEIIYTSGTTGEPKGVMITHGNLLANLVPIYEEYLKYKKFATPFAPIRFIHLIPLSHLFGQVMGLFIPQMLNGTVIYSSIAAPQIMESAKENRASVITCVPQQLSLLRKYVTKRHSLPDEPPIQTPSVLRTVLSRWWRYRSIHSELGWKFWAFIVGGATLPVEEEQFWSRLGFAVIQGYGMTETAPSITITHPFKGIKAGFVGKKLPGLEIQIAEDGEILVRGPHVSPGYYKNASATEEVFKDGWLHTGDIGRLDEEGNLQLLGRKKEVIVTSEGLNVYPEDVERVLKQHSGVADAAVVSRLTGSRSVVHAVFIFKDPEEAGEAERIVSEANQKLESFQRIQSFGVWPDSEFPRTSTGKLKRTAIAETVAAEGTGLKRDSDLADTPESIARQLLSGVTIHRHLDQDLGLSSLDRVELMMELESSAGKEMDEAAFAQAKTLGDVAKLLERSEGVTAAQHYPYWKWPQWLPFQWLRYFLWYTIAFPAMPLRMKVEAEGLENLEGLKPPVFFVSNHQSILDAPAILKALPTFDWRASLAPAMGVRPSQLDLYLAALFFNIYPLPSGSIGLRKAIELTGDLADQGYSPLVFPEGVRTPDGKLGPFRPGVGVMVNHTKLLVVPIFVEGAYKIWPVHSRGPKYKGTVNVRFESPIDFSGKSPAQITAELEAFYRKRLG